MWYSGYMSTARKKIDMLNMRVEPTQKLLLEQAAEASGKSVTSFVLEHAMEAAHRELDVIRNYSLSLRDARAFMAALEKPASANPALRQAFLAYEKKYSRAKR
jgi:uncharacterized protein (DUF1778 family)